MDTPLDDEAMAQAMGFSSFGHQNRPQKRKYNPHADAVIRSDSKTAQRAAKASATGSNSTPLGVPSSKPNQAAANADEIDLDEDEDGIPEPAETPAALVRPHGLPERPVPGTGFIGSPGGHQGGHGHHQDGSRNHTWYEGYYDPKSNENPWKRLEGSKGLQPMGTYLS
ncbi:hypothetical protein M441DRAFT_128157 [Trichoderma asperellum CBS 433.97]|uniref:Uncharacterized protein n=1 Tax=Trichoderma asperellum (strain ATCC 204424 / CBS 433.97 / NBRC 101777) TaxID=1042311 RepID=A0A2T3ZNF4_TRIA4|nr:hypothetical protein M441DRAFT_128157 [Trichoderma asperellum CBS 433.97]PTB46321.1 hypothetical protein M441DRAFT_128157 [Trichoderma asperellum CBS 433.97]